MMRRSLCAWLILAAVGLAQSLLPPALRDVGIDQRLNEQAPLDLAFRDEMGREVNLRRYFGAKPVVVALVYYECPMLCTLALNGLLGALKAIPLEPGRDFRVVTVSFDPREGPALAKEKKAQYLARYKRAGAEESWHFLTGKEASIQALARSLGFRYTYDEKTGQFAHAAAIMILTPEGRIARYLYGIEYPPRDLRLALVEASAGRIGSKVDQALLYCFHYDPSTGKYTLAVMNVVRVLGGATVLALGTFMIGMFRRDRRRVRSDVRLPSIS